MRVNYRRTGQRYLLPLTPLSTAASNVGHTRNNVQGLIYCDKRLQLEEMTKNCCCFFFFFFFFFFCFCFCFFFTW